MPITVNRLESRIYHSKWADYVSVEDMQASMQRRQELAASDNAESYVVIVEISQGVRIPFNLEALRQAIEGDPKVLAFIVVGVTLQARILVESLMKISPTKLEIADSLEDALKRARSLLEGK
jgi:hypothetical protein